MPESTISEVDHAALSGPEWPSASCDPNSDARPGNAKPKAACCQPARTAQAEPVAPQHPAGTSARDRRRAEAPLASAQRAPVAPEPPACPSAPPADPLAKRSEWSNWAVLAVLVLCFVLIVRFKPHPAPQAFWQAEKARALEQLELVPLTPGARSIHSRDLTGRVVLLSFWAAADQQAPHGISRLAKVERALGKPSGFRLLVVCCGPNSKEDVEGLERRAREMIDQAGVGIEAYADPGAVTRSAVHRAVGLRGYPTTLLVDRQGRVRGSWFGLPAGADEQMHRLALRLLQAES